MKLLSYHANGQDRYGIVTDSGVIDASAELDDRFPDLKAAIAGAMDDLRALAESGTPSHRLDDIVFLPPIAAPEKIICVGLNYALHVQETRRSDSDYPVIFNRFANTHVGHKQPMIKAKNSDRFDYEGELALIIGERARHVPKERALDVIAGYSIYNDGTMRDWQSHTHQFAPGKNFTASGAFGPWIVTADEIPDPTKLTLTTRLNGEEMQRADTDQLIFDIPTLINYISAFAELVPGDVIPTGTPGGVGFKRNPPVFMKGGDTIEVEITGIGTLINPIEDE